MRSPERRNAKGSVRKPRPIKQLIQKHMIANQDRLFHGAGGNHGGFRNEGPNAEDAHQDDQQGTDSLPDAFPVLRLRAWTFAYRLRRF